MQNSKKRYHKKWSKIETEALKDLYCNKFYSIDEISKILGRTEASVLNKIKSKKFTRGMEFSHEDYDKLFQEKYELMKQDGYIIENGEPVRDVEKQAKIKKKANSTVKNRYEPIYRDIEDSFRSFFGTKVKIDAKQRSGKIIIQYSSNEDLERI